MSALWVLLLLGLLLGDGLAAVGVAISLVRSGLNKRRRGEDASTFWVLAGLFLGIAIFLVLWLIAGSYVPRTQPEGCHECRPAAYRWLSLSCLSVLAAGLWPASLHFIFGVFTRRDKESRNGHGEN